MTVNWDAPTQDMSALVSEKLTAFERLHLEFEDCFTYVQNVHGEQRFAAFPVDHTVRYLHALWICDCKDGLLSIPKSTQRYEGTRALTVLRDWCGGDSVGAVALLHRKLDAVPFAELTRQMEEAARTGYTALAERLAHGRQVLLNRTINLHTALDAIFALDPQTLMAQVLAAADRFAHSPSHITVQLAELETPLYSYVPHPALAEANMHAMNRLGIRMTDNLADRPGNRTLRVEAPDMPLAPYAQEVIQGEHGLSGMADNNPQHLNLPMPPIAVDAPDMVRPPNDLVGPEHASQR